MTFCSNDNDSKEMQSGLKLIDGRGGRSGGGRGGHSGGGRGGGRGGFNRDNKVS